MAKITLLQLATALTGDETIPLVQDGKTVRGAIGPAIAEFAAPSVALAQAFAEASATSAAVAATDGPFYDSVAEGEAATVPGDEFAVAVGGGASWYRRTPGGSVNLFELPTAAATARITTRGGIPALPIVGTAYAIDVNAYYVYDPISSAAVDGWGVIAALGGVGRWILNSDGVTISPSGGDDTATLMAAGNAMAAAGKAMFLTGGQFVYGQWVFPTHHALTVYMRPDTDMHSTLTPGIPDAPDPEDRPSPANAGLYCVPGAQDRNSTVAAINGVSESTITISDSVVAGEMLRIRDTTTGGFRGNRYMVESVEAAGADYIVTVERPILTRFSVGDAVEIWEQRRAFGHRIYCNGARFTGTGDRMFEFGATEDCQIHDFLGMPGACESFGSFDTFGHNNFAIGKVFAGSSGANNGFLLETQEGSVTWVEATGFAIDGIRWLNNENCADYSRCYGNQFGITIGGEANLLGCNNSKIRGNYDSNAAEGLSVIVGSRGTDIDAVARFNPVNLSIGDAGGGNVSSTTVRGDFSSATVAGIVVFPSAFGTSFGVIDTSGSPIGINNQGNILGALHRHRGAAATHILLNAGGIVDIAQIDYNSTTGGINAVSTTGAGRTTIRSGLFNSGAGSNLFQGLDASHTEIGQVVGATAGGFFGSLTAGASMRLAEGTEIGGTAGLEGLGKYIIPGKQLHRGITASNTPASVDEVELKDYSIPLNTLRTGSWLKIKALGSYADNANSKTVRLYLGGDLLIEIAGPVSEAAGWEINADVFVLGLTDQSFTASGSSNPTPVSGLLELDVTTDIEVSLTGQNGAASAGDIVCHALLVERMAQ